MTNKFSYRPLASASPELAPQEVYSQDTLENLKKAKGRKRGLC